MPIHQAIFIGELPPRARRILRIVATARPSLGTTSACAENTFTYIRLIKPMGNYLRVRGEYRRKCTALSEILELPPRARRIPFGINSDSFHIGTTSACAENTVAAAMTSRAAWNYLRVRGEYRRRAKSPIRG